MSLFNWFSGKSTPSLSTTDGQAKQVSGRRETSAEEPPQRSSSDVGSQEHKRKLERYARREKLYIAIREAMTRAGILSASYKFKVLSLDRRDSEFLVMMDLGKLTGDVPKKVAEMEALVIHNAKARFDITVSAVYWRLNVVVATSKPVKYPPEASVIVKSQLKKKPAVHESIEAAEVAAFELAVREGGKAVPKPASSSVHPEIGSRADRESRVKRRNSEDMEAADSVSPRSLSGTQYGELN